MKKTRKIVVLLLLALSLTLALIACDRGGQEAASFIVAFNTDGGSIVTAQIIDKGGKVARPTPDPTKENYDFDNWYKDSAKTELFNFETETVNSDIIIYAKWNLNKTNAFIASFDTDGGSGKAISSQTIAKGGKVTRPIPDPTKENYDFDNWYKDSEKTELFNFETETVYSDITIYAKWNLKPASAFIASFNTDGGKAIPSQTIEKGGKATRPASIPTKKGYSFDNWYKDSEKTELFNFDTEIIMSDIVIYAKWEIEEPASHSLKYRIINDEVQITGFDGEETEVTIPKTIESLPVTSIATYAFIESYDITSITIPNTVSTIGIGAFSYCYSLQTITIPKSVKSIGSGAFASCHSLTNINVDSANEFYVSRDGVLFNKDQTVLMGYPAGKATAFYSIPDTVTKIEFGAFYECLNLTEIDIPNGVTAIGKAAFFGCEKLASVEIPDSVIHIEKGAFVETAIWNSAPMNSPVYIDSWIVDYKDSLKNVTINEGTVGISDYALAGSGLESITIPDSIAYIGEAAFANCSKLKDIILDGENNYYSLLDGVLFNKAKTTIICFPTGKTITVYEIPDTVTNIGNGAFYGCTKLTSVTIPSGVTRIGDDAFYGCYGISEIELPDGLTVIGDSAFLECYKLESIEVPGSVASIGNKAFLDCYNLETVTICSGVQAIGDSAFSNCYKLESIIIPGSVKTVGANAFSACIKITSLTLQNGVETIGDYAFSNCNQLQTIIIPNSVVGIGDAAFASCSMLTKIEVETENNSFISINGVLFNKQKTTLICYPAGKSGTAYSIPDTVTRIGAFAFSDCVNLESITILIGVTLIEDFAFSNCTALETIAIPNGVTRINNYLFSSCESLTSVSIPSTVTRIGMYVFADCYSLDNVTIPGGVISIGDFIFFNCTKLTSIEIPDSVTSIGYGAFYYCIELSSLTIGEGITSIGAYAFSDCNKLTSVTFDNPSGWYVTITENESDGTDVVTTDSSDNATNLVTTYYAYYWYRISN